MKRVVLHIGFPKTGTTSFQLFCRSHRALLAEHGCRYPDLHVADHPEAGHGALLGAMLTDPPPRLAPHAAPSRQALRETVDAFARDDADVLLLSHETLSQARGLDHDELRARIGGDPLTIVAVVRTLDHWIESLYAQSIKAENAVFKPLAKSRLGRLTGTRALPRLNAWREAWPRAEFAVLAFERARRAGIVESLLDAAGVCAPEILAAAAGARHENPSPGALATLFVGYATLGTGDFAASKPLLSAWHAAGEPPLDGAAFGLLPPAFKAEARASYIADLPVLRRRYGLEADEVAPCTPAELDYRHTLTRAEYALLLDWLAPHVADLAVDRFRAAFDKAAPQLA